MLIKLCSNFVFQSFCSSTKIEGLSGWLYVVLAGPMFFCNNFFPMLEQIIAYPEQIWANWDLILCQSWFQNSKFVWPAICTFFWCFALITESYLIRWTLQFSKKKLRFNKWQLKKKHWGKYFRLIFVYLLFIFTSDIDLSHSN